MASNLSEKEYLPDGNVKINIGSYEDDYENDIYFDYNVSYFFKEYDSMGSKWHQMLNKFTESLTRRLKWI